MKNHYKTEIKKTKTKTLSLKFHVKPGTFETEIFWGWSFDFYQTAHSALRLGVGTKR